MSPNISEAFGEDNEFISSPNKNEALRQDNLFFGSKIEGKKNSWRLSNASVLVSFGRLKPYHDLAFEDPILGLCIGQDHPTLNKDLFILSFILG